LCCMVHCRVHGAASRGGERLHRRGALPRAGGGRQHEHQVQQGLHAHEDGVATCSATHGQLPQRPLLAASSQPQSCRSVNIWQSYEQERGRLVHFLRLFAVWLPGTHNYVLTCNFAEIFTEFYYTRRYFNVRPKADTSQLNLPYGNRQLKSGKQEN